MEPCFGLAFAAVAALVIVLIIANFFKNREKQTAFAGLAREWGFDFYPSDPWDLPERHKNEVEFFTTGHSRRASNIIAGAKDGRRLLVFEYKYSTGSGDDETTHHRSVAMLELPIRAPRLQLRDEAFSDTVSAWLGHDDIDFESDEFSRRYFVKCTERKFAYDIFHQRLIEYLLACGKCPSLEMSGTFLVLHSGELGVAEVRGLAEIGQEIVRSIPDYVVRERGAAAR